LSRKAVSAKPITLESGKASMPTPLNGETPIWSPTWTSPFEVLTKIEALPAVAT